MLKATIEVFRGYFSRDFVSVVRGKSLTNEKEDRIRSLQDVLKNNELPIYIRAERPDGVLPFDFKEKKIGEIRKALNEEVKSRKNP